MAKKRKRAKAPTAHRIDVNRYGIDLPSLITEIRPHLDGLTYAEVAELAGISEQSVSKYLNGTFKPSLGAVAALAHAAGGRVQVSFKPKGRSPRRK